MAKPRCKTFRAFMYRHLKQEMPDIASHGADSGWPHLTYTRDTVEIFDAYADEIWELARTNADDVGAKNVMEFVAGFKCADMAETFDGFKNALVWFAAETVSQEYETDRKGFTP